jgi:Phytanoyl-CoA dioxygenase (PhyH)
MPVALMRSLTGIGGAEGSPQPGRMLTADELQRYRDDGVIILKGAVDPSWISIIEAGVEEARRQPSLLSRFMTRRLRGFEMDIFLWKRVDLLRDTIYYGPFARWAQQLMGSREVRFFYDQMFNKEPGADVPTPWHQDLSFWPIRGEQICSFWIPLDPVDKRSSGLYFVRGSHKWAQRYKAISPGYVAAIVDPRLDDVPDINASPGKYDLVRWDMEPTDILMFHPLTLHGSYGNTTTRRRRALALRWAGDDVVYAPHPMRLPIYYQHDAKPGGPLRGGAFPRILPTFDPRERQARIHRERPALGKVARTLWAGAIPAARQWVVSPNQVSSLKQTWNASQISAP